MIKKSFVYIILLVLGFSLFALTGCVIKDVKIEGEVIKKEYTELEGKKIVIEDISLKENFSTIRPSVRFNGKSKTKLITIKAQEGLFDYINVKEKGDTIIISGNSRDYYLTNSVQIEVNGYYLDEMTFDFCEVDIDDTSCGKNYTLNASAASEVRFNYYNGDYFNAHISGASRLTLNAITATEVTIIASGASKFNGTDIETSTLKLTLSGASKSIVYGGAGDLELECSGASSFEGDNFRVDKASVHLSGASSALVKASESLDYELSGASSLIYYGNPNISKAKTSGGSTASKQGK